MTQPLRDPTPAGPGSPRHRVARPTLGVLVVLALTGCVASTGPVGDSGQIASYSLGTLTMDLEGRVEPAVAAAAAEASLRDLGLTITRREVTGEGAVVTARRPDARVIESTTVRARPSGARTHVTVSVAPLGDETLSYALLDAMMVRLGR